MHPASARTSASVPDLVGRYEILLPIASGGMATVYLARAVGTGGFSTEVALKLTHAHLRTSTEFTNDLVEEAKLASRIRHRNVVAIIDVGDDPQGVYLAMEYVEGDTLAGIFRAKPRIPQPLGVRILLDSLAGLHAAHELRDEGGQLVGLVHRDFTPQNILVGIDGVARLADFGIAKAATRLGHTRTGIVKGKIPYMAPEQAHGVVLDRRCDVWAAGIVAWELFAERRLYRNDDDVSTLLRVATERPPLLRTVVPDL
ncbi:MAG TPA: serine/threonine-protein kinase, partial [Polyangiaceae bacterium]